MWMRDNEEERAKKEKKEEELYQAKLLYYKN
jgi:hypothetical protein